MQHRTQKINIWARRKSRRLVVQALYQWHCNKTDIDEVIEQYQVQHKRSKKIDWAFFITALTRVIQDSSALDASILPFLDRPETDIDIIEKAILRMGAWELTTDTPIKVVINEAIDIAKEFAGTDSYKYINSILDALANTYSKKKLL